MAKVDPKETFLQEVQELLEQLEQGLLDLEQKRDDKDIIDSVFRAIHTIKGSGAMFGFDEIAQFIHEFETTFDQIRKGQASVNPELIKVALSAKDHIIDLLEDPQNHAEKSELILKQLRTIVDIDTQSSNAVTLECENENKGEETWRINFFLPENALILGTNPSLILAELRSLGDCKVVALTDPVPSLESINPENCYIGWEVTLTTEQPKDVIEDVFIFLKENMKLTIEPLNADTSDVSDNGADDKNLKKDNVTQKAEGQASVDQANSSIRVPAERLDELMDRVGELVIAQARLSQIAGMNNDPNLNAISEEIERLSSGLRDTTMGIRMVPIGTLFGRFRRLVHDLSRELGKDVEFITAGEETELDKTVVERLADPLVHLIRNAIDHGLETPEDRKNDSKSLTGQLRLTAVHTGSEVAIAISDDGIGLNAEKIRNKAEEAGLIARESKMTDHEAYQLIFQPGLSTAQKITSISGRGVGMDVVKRIIDNLRGNIDVSSKPGEGTTVTLRLPLTLAIIEGMLVRVGNGRYSIPLSAVEECVELPHEAEIGDSGRNFLNIRGSLVPFLRLRELFKTSSPGELHQKVVIVSAGDQRVGLVVDQILGNNQTVIKSLSKLHANVETFSGATILGDGTVALILDVIHLVRFGQDLEDKLRHKRHGRAA